MRKFILGAPHAIKGMSLKWLKKERAANEKAAFDLSKIF